MPGWNGFNELFFLGPFFAILTEASLIESILFRLEVETLLSCPYFYPRSKLFFQLFIRNTRFQFCSKGSFPIGFYSRFFSATTEMKVGVAASKCENNEITKKIQSQNVNPLATSQSSGPLNNDCFHLFNQIKKCVFIFARTFLKTWHNSTYAMRNFVIRY